MKNQLFTAIAFVFSINTFAQWNTNTAINTAVSVASKSQDNIHAIPDTKAGIIMAWDDNQNNSTSSTDIYAQRIKNNGVARWANGGIPVCGNSFTQKSSAITESDNGSCIITWEDNRNGDYDIYAQKIDSLGNALWATDGLAICSKTKHQKSPKIISDNVGGAIVVWEDSVSFYFDVYAQRINSSGVLQWTNTGVPLCTASNNQINPKLDTDGLNGAIVTWQDKRNNSDYDIYAQRINASGIVQWAANGISICNSTNVQNNPRVEPDGNNGAYIAWVDKRNGLNYDIYAQRVDGAGTVLWTSNGLAICTATNNQTAQDIKYLGTGGLSITWKDDRSGKFEIYAQVVSSNGITQQVSNGILLSNSSSLRSINPNSVVDGLGGCIIVWQDSIASGFNIYSQKINSSGVPQWTTGGEVVSSAVGEQTNPTLVFDATGGAIFAWEDDRNGNSDIYAHHLYYNGSATVGLFEIEQLNEFGVVCFPNPINETSVIKPLHVTENWCIDVYDFTGKRISTQMFNENDTYKPFQNQIGSGIYFYSIRLLSSDRVSGGRFIVTN